MYICRCMHIHRTTFERNSSLGYHLTRYEMEKQNTQAMTIDILMMIIIIIIIIIIYDNDNNNNNLYPILIKKTYLCTVLY